MTTPHPSAKLLRAIADGKQMQSRIKFTKNWEDCSANRALHCIICFDAGNIRIKPDTVTINGVVCPVPMLEVPEHPDLYWTPDLEGDAMSVEWSRFSSLSVQHLSDGLCFDTEEAAQAVAEAMIKPLREYVKRAKGGKE